LGPLDRNRPRTAGIPRAPRRVLRRSAALTAVGACLALGACGGDDDAANGGLGELPTSDDPVHPLPPGKPEKEDRGAAREPARDIRLARCPPGAANCASAAGVVLYIESVDPDGDGDLHVVANATRGDAVTGGGLVVFDVNKDLRPARDPKPGDQVTGAGPVYRGSYGQRQIEVDEFRVARR
jgi:hypothetical protein